MNGSSPPEGDVFASIGTQGVFYRVFFDFLELRDVLVARGRRKTKSHTCDFKFNYLQIQKIGVSSLFFVASDDSKDHERPNKDSKR